MSTVCQILFSHVLQVAMLRLNNENVFWIPMNCEKVGILEIGEIYGSLSQL